MDEFIYFYKEKNTLKLPAVFIPLLVYAALILLSSIFSKYSYFSFHGIYEQFESVFVLLGYCLTAYYTFLTVKTLKDVTLLLKALMIGSLLVGIIGLTQITGHNFLSSPTGWKMITDRSQWNSMSDYNFVFSTVVYSTLYNPNYFGSYAAIVLPLLTVSAFVTKELRLRLGFAISAVITLICLVGSQSSTGVISVGAGLVLAIILYRQYIFHYKKIALFLMTLFVALIILINFKFDNYTSKRLQAAFGL